MVLKLVSDDGTLLLRLHRESFANIYSKLLFLMGNADQEKEDGGCINSS